MGMKASEVSGWLRQRAGERDHRKVLSDNIVVVRPGPNFEWIMGNLAAGPPASPAPEHDHPSEDGRQQDECDR
jgi:hypothetical protein